MAIGSQSIESQKSDSKMFVIKRDGRKESVMFDKITSRISKLCYNLDMNFIDPPAITLKVLFIFSKLSLFLFIK